MHTVEGSLVRATILIADESAEWLDRVREILRERPEWQIMCEAFDGSQAVQKTRELRPDIVVLDIGMPVLNGIDAARRIRQASPQSRIVFLTREHDADVRTAALATGATGYLLKATAAKELVPALEAALKNGHYSPIAGD